MVSRKRREIARVASVHPCAVMSACTLGDSAEVAAVVATQRRLVPNLSDPVADGTITCVDATGALHTPCNFATDSVKVVVSAPFSAVTPIISSFGSWAMTGSATFQIQ